MAVPSDLVGVRKRGGADLGISQTPIERRQLGPQIDDRDIGGATAPSAAVGFGDIHQSFAKTLALLRRIDGDHSDIDAVAANLHLR
jgi:hypothetical protein